jgi:UDP-N-acetylglucosamine 2-epimerase (non-hydrolysing)
MKLKVLTILGTRPEIVRLSRIISKLNIFFDHVLVNTGQNYDTNLSSIFFKELKLRRPDYNLNCKNKNSVEFISEVLVKIDSVLLKEKPDAVLVLGDTNSALSVLVAKKRQIPIFHIEAGNRCFDLRVPEEINRSLIDKISDINMVYSDVAKNNLIKENFSLDKIIKIGSPLREVFEYYKFEIEDSKILNQLNLTKKNYILVSCHREENLISYDNLNKIFLAISKISKKHKAKLIFSTHPRIQKILKNIKKSLLKNILFHKPFGYFDYVQLQKNSKLTISDSGSIVEESNILNFPALNLRETTERQEGMEKASVVISSLKIDNIVAGAEIAISKFSENSQSEIHQDYSELNVSNKVVTIIQSYTDYINRKVWFRQ